MITVTVTTSEEFERATNVMKEEVAFNPAFNGATFEVTYGDGPSVEGADEISGSQVFARIFR